MMQEVNTDDTNGESTFEFVERRLENTHISNNNPSGGVSQPLSQPVSTQQERISLTDSTSNLPSVSTPAPIPQLFYPQSPAPYTSPLIPPPPAALPSYISGVSAVTEPTLTAFPPTNPILSHNNPISSPSSNQGNPLVQPFYSNVTPVTSFIPVATQVFTPATALELPIMSDYSTPGSYQTQNTSYESTGSQSGGVWGWIKGTVGGNEFLHKVAEKAKSSVDSVITTLDPQMSEYIYSGNDYQLVVASDKEVKIEPIREAFQTIIGRATIVTGIAAHSSVAAQPVGYSAGIKGAEDRILALRQSGMVDEKQPIVAIENTLVEVTPERWYDIGCLVLDDRALGSALHSFTQPTPVPIEYVHQLQKDTPADYPLRWSGYSLTIGHAMGLALQVPHAEWHQHVAGVTRRDMIFMAAKVLATAYKQKQQGFLKPAYSVG